MEIPSAPASPPVVAGEVVVVATLSGQVLARRTGDGSELWTRDLRVTAPLAADDGRLIVPVEGAIEALAVESGASQWTVETAALTAPPVAGGGWVILAAGERLTALSAVDGDEVWTVQLALVERRPAFFGGLLLVPLADGRLVGMNLESGRVIWEARVGANPTEPFPYGDRVYLGVDGVKLTCLRAEDGSWIWTYTIGASLRGTAAGDTERIYAAAMDNQLWAFRRSNGNRDWIQDLGYRPLSGPILLGPTLAVPGRATTIRMFTPGGRAAAALKLPASAVITPGMARPPAGTSDGAAVPALAIVTGDPGQPWRLSLTGPPLPGLPALTPLSELPGERLPPMSLPGR